MHICVCVKQTPDSSSVYVDPVTGQIDRERFVQVLNPADACAVEAAVRLKEQSGGSVLVITLGPDDAESALRATLASGADTAIRLWTPQASTWGPFTVASALATYIQQSIPSIDLVLCGETSNDWSLSIVGPAIAQQLNLPQITGVVGLKGSGKLQVTRRLERGFHEVLEIEPPALITVTGDLNEPRYPSLPAHFAALKANIPVLDPLPDPTARDESDETTLIEVHTPRPRPRRIVAPDSTHSAYQRIGEIIAVSAATRKVRIVEGPPEELAKALVDFLKKQGFV